MTRDAQFLRWLLRFPLQAAPDLAAMSGLSVPQTYARLTVYEQSGVVRSLRVPMLGAQSRGGKLYHLTDAGLEVLVSAFGHQVWPVAHAWGADEDGLLRALPRIRTLVMAQRLVLAVLTHAAGALGSFSHPVSVEWIWVRDHRQAYRTGTPAHPHLRTFRLVAYVQMRTHQPDEGGSVYIYPFFVLHDTGFGDVRLLRHRLRELLRCRDTFEEHQAPGSFPPLLLVVPSAHRARLWQAYALRLASDEWLVHPLRGGLIMEADVHQPARRSEGDDGSSQGTRRAAHDTAAFSPSSCSNPWHLSWYALDRAGSCSLGDLLRAVPPDATPLSIGRTEQPFPRSAHIPISSAEDPDAAGDPTGNGPRPYSVHPVIGSGRMIPCTAARGVPKPMLASREDKVSGESWEHWEEWQNWEPSRVRRWAVWTTLRVERRHTRVLDLLAAHPLLARTDLSAVLDLDAGTITRYLAYLMHLGLVHATVLTEGSASTECAGQRTPAAECLAYALTPPGVYLLATGAGIPIRRTSVWRFAEQDAATEATDTSGANASTDSSGQGAPVHRTLHSNLSPRGVGHDLAAIYARDIRTYARIVEHTRGVYAFFALLHTALRSSQADRTEDAANQVVWWETGRACMRHYRTQQGWRAIRPDGAAELVVHGRDISLWLEWDRSTMSLRDLRAKFAAYTEYVRSREWRTDGNSPLPLLLIVSENTAGETRIAQALHDTVPRQTPQTLLDIRVALASDVYKAGPLADIWRPSWTPGTFSSRGALGPPCSITYPA